MGKPYPEVTADFLPSSLGTTHSFVLVFSTRSPVSVCGTDSVFLSLEIFLGSALCEVAPAEAGTAPLSSDSPLKAVHGFSYAASLENRLKSNNEQHILRSVIPSQNTEVEEY
jgi:hypothetical protein